MSTRRPAGGSASRIGDSPRFGIARVIGKSGHCSRAAAERMVRSGRVELDGRLILDPEFPVAAHQRAHVTIDGTPLIAPAFRYLALNKPRGVTVSTQDEHARDTVYRCLDGAGLPWLAPVGRLDRASEGLLLLSNDSAWSARITDPASGIAKTYHVQSGRVPLAGDMDALRAGIEDAGEMLRAESIRILRSGGRTAWLEVVLHGGRNRQIRRMLAARGLPVLRLLRVALGPLLLGALGKGEWRELEPEEVVALDPRLPPSLDL